MAENDAVPSPRRDGAVVLDGKAVAADITARVKAETAERVARGASRPGLAVVLVGEDPASQVYVRSKGRTAEACGFHSVQHTLPASASQSDLLTLVAALNADPAIHGILVQLPLPSHVNATLVLESVSPTKDVDGFHPLNAGLLAIGDAERAFVPCTPAGAMTLLRDGAKRLRLTLAGMNALVVGRSNIVGKPMARLLLNENCTVTVAHSRTRDLSALVANAEILVAAIGRPEAIPGSWIRPGALVIDVGINRVAADGLTAAGNSKTRLVGDVAFLEAARRAGAITPVPGGVGPMTIAMLMANTLLAAQRSSA